MNNLVKLGQLVAVEIDKVIAVVPSDFGLRITFDNGTHTELKKYQLSQTVAETFDILLKVKKIGFSQGGYTRPSAQPISGVVQPVLDINADFGMEKVTGKWSASDSNVGNENIDSKPLFSAPIEFVLHGATPIGNFKLDLLNALKLGRFIDDQIANAIALSNFEHLNSNNYSINYFAEEDCTKLFCPSLGLVIIKKYKSDESLMLGYLKRAIVTISEFKE